MSLNVIKLGGSRAVYIPSEWPMSRGPPVEGGVQETRGFPVVSAGGGIVG